MKRIIILIALALPAAVFASETTLNRVTISYAQSDVVGTALSEADLRIGFPSLLVFKGQELILARQTASDQPASELADDIQAAKQVLADLRFEQLSRQLDGLKKGESYTVVLLTVGKGSQPCPPCISETRKVAQLGQFLPNAALNEIYVDIAL